MGVKRLILAARRENELQKVKSECLKECDTLVEAQIETMFLDLSKPEECLQIGTQLSKRIGTIDILINNGGVSQRCPFEEMDFENAIDLINVNTLAPIALIKSLLPSLERAKRPQIVNVSSIAGLVGVGVRSCYAASKFGIAAFSKSLRAELACKHIEVQNVYPGYVQTDISKNAHA